MSDGIVLLIGAGRIERITGAYGTTPDCPDAKFHAREVVLLRRMKHLAGLPDKCAIIIAIPPGFSPDHAWDDYCGRPRRLMCTVPARHVTYLVAFEGKPTPMLIREGYLWKLAGEPLADIQIGPAS